MVFDSIIFAYTNKPVLRGVYLHIPKNSVTGLFGINGCGKSTLLNIGTGFLKQDDGNVFIDDEAYTNSLSVARYNKIGYLSQESFLPKDLRVSNFLKLSNCPEEYYIEDPLINKVFKQKIGSLSGGELRYLEVLFLFSLEREYYLFDEPFTGIEPNIIENLSALISRQKTRGAGILITDHYHQYVTEIIDRCYLLKDGYSIEIKHSGFSEGLAEAGYLARY